MPKMPFIIIHVLRGEIDVDWANPDLLSQRPFTAFLGMPIRP